MAERDSSKLCNAKMSSMMIFAWWGVCLSRYEEFASTMTSMFV